MIYRIISAVDLVMKHRIFYSILYLVLYKFIQSLPKYGVVGLEFTRLLGPCLDDIKVPNFFTLFLSHQFLDVCMEY